MYRNQTGSPSAASRQGWKPSASVVTDATGTVVGEQRYYPFGETRGATGSMFTDKLFTGQREMAGLGIYHYGARFYSPKLGRFLSADTIVPGYANPQTLNRYSYVANNPLKYTDPTGHKCNPDDGCETPHGDKGGDIPLTHKGDPIPGSDKTVAYGGAAAYEMYLQYKNFPGGGWWNDYGNADFGLAEFLGMWALFESAGNLKTAKVIATIIAQNLYNGGNNPAACPSGKCFNGAFNFMAAYSGGTTGMLGGIAALHDYESQFPKVFGDGANKGTLISMLGKIALSRSSLKPEWTQRTGPSNWGNVTDRYPGWLQAVREAADDQIDPPIKEHNINGTADNTIYYYYGDAFYYSIAQLEFWNPK